MHEPNAADYHKVRSELLSWAAAGNVDNRRAIVDDLADIREAAIRLAALIDELPRGATSSNARTLIAIQTWLYDELMEHANAMRENIRVAVEGSEEAADQP